MRELEIESAAERKGIYYFFLGFMRGTWRSVFLGGGGFPAESWRPGEAGFAGLFSVYLIGEMSSGLDLARKAFVRRLDKAIGSESELALQKKGLWLCLHHEVMRVSGWGRYHLSDLLPVCRLRGAQVSPRTKRLGGLWCAGCGCGLCGLCESPPYDFGGHRN